MKQRSFWYLLNVYGWVILIMSIVTAYLVGQIWIVLLGVIGYQAALLVDMVVGRNLGRTGAVRLALIEQENRELRAEQARLMGAIREREDRLAELEGTASQESVVISEQISSEQISKDAHGDNALT